MILMPYQSWNPWRALRDQREVRLWFVPLDGRRGLWVRDGNGDVIVLDPSLGRCERRCVLAHELIHLERGIGHGAASPATMEKEEEIVRREVARRLVPRVELALLIATRSEIGGISAQDVSSEFDVEVDVAEKALEMLRIGL